MLTFNELKKRNPDLSLFDISTAVFSDYGRLLDYDCSEIIAEARKISMPEQGSKYLPSVENFERLSLANVIRERLFGTLETQIGYCYGYNTMLNAAEWHSSSELNIAITPLVLILGKRADIQNDRIDSAKMKAFYVPAGTVLEVYATTLHFCPCQVQKEGFGCVVGLPRGTNLPLEQPTTDRLLFRKNKWLLAHNENTDLINRGAVAGIYGQNFKVRYEI